MKQALRSFLLAAGVGCLCAPSQAEPIHLYARQGKVEKVLGEIEKGVPIDLPATSHTSDEGVSALYIAAKFGKADVVKALLAAGADPTLLFRWGENAYYYGTPLHAAAGWGHEEIVEILIDAGADPARYNSFIGTPLHLARQRGHQGVVAKLLAAGAVERVEQPSVAHLIAGADPEAGRVTARGCGICHSTTAEPQENGMQGPSLWGVVGRPAASVPGYDYSDAMKASGVTWTYDELNSWLAAPYLFVPGTKMILTALEDQKVRVDLIAYLRTLSDDPVPLP